MPETRQTLIDESEALRLFDAGEVCLTRGAGRWALFAVSKTGQKFLGHLPVSAVDLLRQRGHLVARPDGSLEPLRQRERKSGRMLAQRAVPRDDNRTDKPLVNDAESPLSWLHSRKDKAGRPLISDEQYRAGERLRADFERGLLARRITANWDPAGGGTSAGNAEASMSDGTLAARQRHHAAMAAVGPELSSILLQVCCLSMGLEQAERLLDLPQRSGKAVLGLALTALARHYGLGPARGRAGNSPLHWGAAGYRPAISELEDA